MNYDDAIKQLQSEIAAKGKFSIKNAPDYLLGIATTNKQQLQDLLDKLLKNKGVLSQDDQTAVNELLEKQKQARKEKTKVIVRNIIIGVGTIGTGVAFWFTFKSKKK